MYICKMILVKLRQSLPTLKFEASIVNISVDKYLRGTLKTFIIIDPSPGVWLTGDLTNHNAEAAILFDKQTRQES